MTEEISQNELLAQRREKLETLRSKGNATLTISEETHCPHNFMSLMGIKKKKI